MKNVLILSVLVLSAPAFAGEPRAAAKTDPASAKQFELIKSLAGDWQGTTTMEGKPLTTKTTFRVTSAGSAVVETINAGTPHEMTNVYHLVDGRLMMTHYCALGNAPQMRAVKGDDKSLAFETVRGNGIDPKKTPHMHGVSYAIPDKDHLSATWTAANMGEEHASASVFSYTRVP